ncbi:MAG: hypothetical protein ACT4QE_02040, partial [Anaerolineales bacterium]
MRKQRQSRGLHIGIAFSALSLLIVSLSLLRSLRAAAQPLNTPTPMAPIAMPMNRPERGLVYEGLIAAQAGPCLGAFQIAETDYCTHGPDEAPAGYNVFESAPPVSVSQLNAGTQALTCDGDGTTGYRVQVIYARAADRADRFAQFTTSLHNWVRDVDIIFEQSAAETGGWRKV